MYLQPTTLRSNPASDIARSGGLDALIALDRIGATLRFQRNQEIYAEGDDGGA
jgi:hypothetical protein